MQSSRLGFTPLVIHPWGGVTPDSLALLHHICRLYTDATTSKPTAAERMSLLWQQFTSQIMCAVARQLRLTTYTGPQGPSLPTYLPVDAAGNELPLSWAGALPTSLGRSGPKRPRAAQWPQSVPLATHDPYRQF